MENRTSFEMITPEEAGIPSAAVRELVDEADKRKIQFHSLMVLRHGRAAVQLWWKPYAPDIPHHLYSFSKSITATAVGFALDEGLLSLDSRITDIFPRRAGKTADPRVYSMTVRHLLTMTSGSVIANEAGMGTQTDWVSWFLNAPLASFPGDRFNYNSLNTYMLSAVIRMVSGVSLTDYLMPRLFGPLGIPRPDWAKCPMGIECGGWGLSLTTDEMARFCQLYLDGGKWRGKQLLPKGWAEAVGQKYADSSVDDKFGGSVNSVNGYGYQFWVNRDGSYRADGLMGQYGIILPEKDAVIITTAGNVEQMQSLDLLYEKLIPYIDYIPERSPAGEQYVMLCALSDTLSLPQPEAVERPAELESLVSGKEYYFGGNLQSMLPFAIRYMYDITPLGIEALSVTFGEKECSLRWREDGGEHAAAFTLDGEYTSGSLEYAGHSFPTAVCAAWTAPDTLEIDIRAIRTPHMLRVMVRFDGDDIHCRFDEDPPVEDTTRHLLGMVKMLRPLSGRISKFVSSRLPELLGSSSLPGEE